MAALSSNKSKPKPDPASEPKDGKTMKPRRLKGHIAAVTCCIAARSRPGVVASSAEDGRVCWFDLRCKDVLFTIDAAKEPISSLCFKAGNEDILYASSGTQISCFDVNMASSSWKPLETYNYNKDEINQIAFSPNSYFLAAADDSGDVKSFVGIRRATLCIPIKNENYATMLGGFVAVCSFFLGSHAITGGLDSKLAMWDFSKGRACKVMDYGMPQMDGEGSSSNIGQCFNPAFVHSVAVPEVDTVAGLDKVCAVARGDGVVDVIEGESEPVRMSKTSTLQKSRLRSKDGKKQPSDGHMNGKSMGKRIQLDYSLGGHTAAVSCVTFSLFGERGRFLISGGNDASVKLWDWSKHFHSTEPSSNNALVSDINIKKKVNWLCTTPADSENLIVCDTSNTLKAYTIP